MQPHITLRSIYAWSNLRLFPQILSRSLAGLPLTLSLMPALLSDVAIAAMAKADLQAGPWVVDGIPSPSGKAMVVVIAKAQQDQWQVTLPKDLLPGAADGTVLLRRAGPNVFSGTASDGGKVNVTMTAPGGARMDLSTARKNGIAKFGFNISLIKN